MSSSVELGSVDEAGSKGVSFLGSEVEGLVLDVSEGGVDDEDPAVVLMMQDCGIEDLDVWAVRST
jgi:hypothetical protein